LLKSIITLVSLLAIAYLLAVALLYIVQRSLLYYPVAARDDIAREEISFKNNEITLHGWILNSGQRKALIYFGGNSEDITDNINQLEDLFKNYTIYLINYRGYGKSQGKPTERGLFSDAIAIYEQIQAHHSFISLMGRSLGSGVAMYLASKRDIEQLYLLTPYDSIVKVAQTHYPYFPVRHLLKDRFDSIIYAKNITTPSLIITAEFDQVIPLKHAQRLHQYLNKTTVTYHVIAGAEHNNLTSFARYQEVVKGFIDTLN